MLGHHVAALAHGAAVLGHVVVGAAVAVVEAVVLDELHALEREVEPFLTLLDLVVGAREEEHEPPLLAHVLVREEHLAVTAEIVVVPAVLRVGRVFLPPLHRFEEEFLVLVDVGLQFFFRHFCFSFRLCYAEAPHIIRQARAETNKSAQKNYANNAKSPAIL